jgi:S-formylglutathione hydrolase FrmB
LGRETLLALSGRLGVVLALPEAPPLGWYLDGRETAAATFLLRDFLPQVWLQSPRADRSRLALAGLSMGGHGALTLAFRHPELFQAAAALSAVTDLAAHTGGQGLDAQLGLDRALGPAGPEGGHWRPFGAAGLWAADPSAWAGRPLFLGVGQNDRLTLDENRAFHRQLESLGLPHVYQEKPGGHDWIYWSAELPVMVEFLASALGASNNRGF